MAKKVTIYTRVYNTEKYLKKCLDSIINQTFTDFQHIIIDNGCTDGCTEMLRSYAEKYPWVKLIRYEKNRSGIDIREFIDTPYFCQLDSDDWLEYDFLEKMVSCMENENADIVAAGSMFHSEANGNTTLRKVNRRLVLSSNEFSEYYPQYHAIFRTVWAKLYKTDLYMYAWDKTKNFISYGSDTAFTFQALRKANRICIDDSILHHYLVRKTSTSYKYDPSRSDSDIYLYNDAIDFLSAYGPISEENMQFINVVYANAINDTLGVIDGCKLPPEEKLKECRKILERKETQAAYRVDHPYVRKSSGNMLVQALKCGDMLPAENDDFRYIVDTILPVCGATVYKSNIRLFAYDNALLNTLASDDRDKYLAHILNLISEKKYCKQFDLGNMVSTLAKNNPLLCNISDTKFLRKHCEIYMLLWNEKYIDALHQMTDYLLAGKNPDETFLQLYLTLAAALEKVDEFLLGKTKAAVFYFKEKKYDECREILADLSEMGVEDTEEIALIREKLN